MTANRTTAELAAWGLAWQLGCSGPGESFEYIAEEEDGFRVLVTRLRDGESAVEFIRKED